MRIDATPETADIRGAKGRLIALRCLPWDSSEKRLRITLGKWDGWPPAQHDVDGHDIPNGYAWMSPGIRKWIEPGSCCRPHPTRRGSSRQTKADFDRELVSPHVGVVSSVHGSWCPLESLRHAPGDISRLRLKKDNRIIHGDLISLNPEKEVSSA